MEIKNKKLMYAHLRTGKFGNYVPQYFSYEDFLASGYTGMVGIRSLQRGGLCIYDVPAEDIPKHLPKYHSGYNISPMQKDENILIQGEVYRDESGLRLFASTVKKPMRKALAEKGIQYTGAAALLILKDYLDASSFEDLMETLDKYDGHVVEFSCYSRKVGLYPNRNTVIWEVRKY